MKCWLSGCDEVMKIRMDGGTVGVQIEWQCRLAMLLVNGMKLIWSGLLKGYGSDRLQMQQKVSDLLQNKLLSECQALYIE